MATPVSLGARLTAATKLGRLEDGAFEVRETTVFEDHAFGGEEVEFFGQGRARGVAGESARREVAGDNAVAWDFRRKRVSAQGLADGARRAAADAAPESCVGNHFPARDFAECSVNAPGERGRSGFEI